MERLTGNEAAEERCGPAMREAPFDYLFSIVNLEFSPTTGADKGRILAQALFKIADDEKAFSLNARCFDAGMKSFALLMDKLLYDSVEMREQDLSDRSCFGKFQRPVGGSLIDFSQPAAAVVAFVAAHDYGRGFPNPFGLPKILLIGRSLHLGRAEVTAQEFLEVPGKLGSVDTLGLFSLKQSRS